MADSRVVVIASHNRSKSREIEALLREGLADLPVMIRLLADYPDAPPPPEENADSYVGNAVIKARACAAFTCAISFADDAGLEIDALDGKPGIYSRRFAGEETPFPVKMGILLEMLKDVPPNGARRDSDARSRLPRLTAPSTPSKTRWRDGLPMRRAGRQASVMIPSSMCRRWAAHWRSCLPRSKITSATARK
jgi:hypothetical protein